MKNEYSSFAFEVDGVLAIGFGELDADVLVERGGDVFADEVGLDGKFAMAAINQYGELDAARASEIVEGIHRGADGAAAEEHVVNENHSLAVDIERDGGGMNVRADALIEVVTVHVDIETAVGDGVAPDLGKERTEAAGELDAATLDADENDFSAVIVALGDFVSDAREGAPEGVGVEDEGGLRHKKSEPVINRIARK
jgi:hypothetical protein